MEEGLTAPLLNEKPSLCKRAYWVLHKTLVVFLALITFCGWVILGIDMVMRLNDLYEVNPTACELALLLALVYLGLMYCVCTSSPD